MTRFFPDNSLTFPWLLVKFPTFPWHLYKSLTFLGFPDKWSPCSMWSLRDWHSNTLRVHCFYIIDQTTSCFLHTDTESITTLWFLYHWHLIANYIFVASKWLTSDTITSLRFLQCESKKNPPWDFLAFFPNGWEFFVQILQACYMFLPTLDYKFLFNYLQL